MSKEFTAGGRAPSRPRSGLLSLMRRVLRPKHSPTSEQFVLSVLGPWSSRSTDLILVNGSTSYKYVNVESNNLLGYASCWIQQLGCLRQCQCDVFYYPVRQGGCHPLVEVDGKIHDVDTASSTQIVGSINLQHPWCHKLLNPTICLGMQVVGSNNLYLYDVDV